MASLPSDGDLIARDAITAGTVSDDAEKATEALEIVEQLRSDFKDRDEAYKVIDDVVFLQNKVKIPDAFKATALQVKSPLAWFIPNQITAALSTKPPKVHFDPVGIGQQAEENQELREAAFAGSWQRQQEEAKRQLTRLATHALVTKGECILKTVERKKRAWTAYNAFGKKAQAEYDGMDISQREKDRLYNAATEEFKRGQPYPICTTDVPPETFYYVKGEDGFALVAEVKQVPYYTTLAQYKMGLNARGEVVPEAFGLPRPKWAGVMDKAGLPMLEMVEVWDASECLYILKDAPAGGKATQHGMVVKRLKHKYGNKALGTLNGPYFHCFGTTTSSREIARQGLSVLFGFLHLFPYLDSLLTLQGQAAYLTGFPILKRVSPDAYGLDSTYGTDSEEMASLYRDIEPGKVFPFDVAAVEPPRAGVDLDKAIASVRSMLDLALPAAAQGVVGDQSGYALNQASHQATLQWAPLISNLQQMLSDRVGFESWLIENSIRENVYVWGNVPEHRKNTGVGRLDKDWLGIGPDDLNGVHRYRVELDPASPSNDTIKLRLIRDKLDLRLMTREAAITEMGGNPLEIERAWLYEEMKADPAIRNAKKQKVFEELGTIEKAMMERAQAQEPQSPPTPNAQIQGSIPPGISPGGAIAPGQPTVPGQPPFAIPNPGPQPMPPAPPGVAPGQPGGAPFVPNNATPNGLGG